MLDPDQLAAMDERVAELLDRIVRLADESAERLTNELRAMGAISETERVAFEMDHLGAYMRPVDGD